MYAIVRTGGKQYRVEQGQSLLVERLPADGGAKVTLEPLLYVDGSTVLDGADEGLSRVQVEARVVGHERGPKLRVVKFKPKRGYRRRTGHRQELTRIEVTSLKVAGRRSKASSAGAESSEAPKPSSRGGRTKAAGRETAAAGQTKAKAPPRRGRSTSAGEPGTKAPARRTRRSSAKEKKDGS